MGLEELHELRCRSFVLFWSLSSFGNISQKVSGSLVPNGNIQKVVPWRATWVRGLTRPAAASPMHTVHTDTHRVATARVGLTGTSQKVKLAAGTDLFCPDSRGRRARPVHGYHAPKWGGRPPVRSRPPGAASGAKTIKVQVFRVFIIYF